MTTFPNVTQIYNCHLERGGEGAIVDMLEDAFSQEGWLSTVRFHSSDWTGSCAPGRLQQALRMIYNPDSMKVLQQHEATQPSKAWLLHNLFPVGSAGIYGYARRHDIPLVVMTHNFRPFSVSGYLWAGGQLEARGLRLNFLPEIRHGAWRGSRLQTAWYAAILYGLHLRGVYRQVRCWIAVSEFMRDRFIEAGIPSERIRTIRHPWRCQQPGSMEVGDDGSYVYMGRLVEMKGVRFLVETWRNLARQLHDKTPLLHICGDGPDRQWVDKQARENLWIRVHGWVDGSAKQKLLRECRALVVPSLCWESLGLVAYEAYDFQKPVIACRSGGLQEVVVDGETGITIPPGDVAAMVDAVLSSERNPRRMRQMGRKGRVFVEQNADYLNWKKNIKNVIANL
jgi:glycosyltransferase involved in cell wall biosynthesis